MLILQQARPKPYVLDDDTVGRVIAVFTTQQDDLWLFDEHLRRWEAQELTDVHRREIGRLTSQFGQLRQVIAVSLALADELKGGTIEEVLVKSDAQLGLEARLRRPLE